MRAVMHVRSRAKETDAVSFTWDLRAQVPDLQRWLWVPKLFKPKRPNSAFVASESVASIGQCALDVTSRAVERCG